MSIAPYIKEIGRGAAGARSLTVEQAESLMGAVLDGRVTDLEVGAFALAMRMKGETLDEITGFQRAVQARCVALPVSRPVVLIPSYNGARRLPNLTPLLAMLLAQQDVPVLLHGPLQDPGRICSAEVLHDLGLPVCGGAADVAAAWARREPAFIATATLCPPLQRLLDVRRVVGVRNSGHSVAKLVDPCHGAPTLRLASYTHPEFGKLMAGWVERGRATAMLLRGTEGEAVADPRRQPRIDTWIDGGRRPDLSVPAQDGVVTELPLLPRENDASTTALYIQAVLSGEKPAPAPVACQVDLVVRTLAALAAPAATAAGGGGL